MKTKTILIILAATAIALAGLFILPVETYAHINWQVRVTDENGHEEIYGQDVAEFYGVSCFLNSCIQVEINTHDHRDPMFMHTLTFWPGEEALTFDDSGGPNPFFLASRRGTYELDLFVLYDDNQMFQSHLFVGITNRSPVAIVTINGENPPPGEHIVVNCGRPVILDGSQSHDPDPDDNNLRFRWALSETPPGSNLHPPINWETSTATFTPDVPGDYEVGFGVWDGKGGSDYRPAIMLRVMPPENHQPMADAGDNQAVFPGTIVTLHGSGSDPDGDPLTYSWSFAVEEGEPYIPEGSQAALTTPNSEEPTFIADMEGEYRLQLVVNDGHINSNPSFVTIYVSRVRVYILTKPQNTFVIQDENGEFNYPEARPIILAAYESDNNGNLCPYSGQHGPIRLRIALQQMIGKSYYHLVELTNNGLDPHSINIDIADNEIEWRGFFHSLGSIENCSMFKAALNNNNYLGANLQTPIDGMNAPNNDLDITVEGGGVGNTSVVVAKAWNYREEIAGLVFEVINIGNFPVCIIETSDGEHFFSSLNHHEFVFGLNADNVWFVREKVPVGEERTYRGDPGLFCVNGTAKLLYKDIEEILFNAEQLSPPAYPPSDGEVDWLQVAATYKCNEEWGGVNKEVFDTVRIIKAYSIAHGYLGLGEAGIIHLSTTSRAMRFNLFSYSGYNFASYKTRTATISHEALHSYNEFHRMIGDNQPGKLLYDKDADLLVVRDPKTNSKNKYFKFSYDHKKRGFKTILHEENSCFLENCLDENKWRWGDTGLNEPRTGYFVEVVNSKLAERILSGEKVSITTVHVPNDLPQFETSLISEGVYCHNPDTNQCFELNGALDELVGFEMVSPKPRISAPYGYYDIDNYVINFFPYPHEDKLKTKLLQLVENGFNFYIVVQLSYDELPWEYDSSLFEITEEGVE